MRRAIAAALLLTVSGAAHALEWRLGVSYATGVEDVTELYEDNLRLAGRPAEIDLKLPIGIAASFIYDWTSEWRTDVGIGPIFVISGDVEHLEAPLSATIGYSFAPYERISPYARIGAIHHFASGDQYSSSTPGLFAAVGIDFSHFALELATDQSKVEFDRLACDSAGANCQLTTTDLTTYDVLFSFYWRFRLDR